MIGEHEKLEKDQGEDENILLKPRKDRRLLSNVPDKEAIRNSVDRRGEKVLKDYIGNDNAFIKGKEAGIRYIIRMDVKIICKSQKSNNTFKVKSLDLSTTGIEIELNDKEQLNIINNANSIKLEFEVLPGSMPEGYEMNVKIKGKKVRESIRVDEKILCGIEFTETLSEYSNRKKGRYVLAISSIVLLFIYIFVILMRAESVIYFKFNKWLYLYSIIAAVFLLSRYLFGFLYKPVPIDVNYTPGVTIIIPCFNEEEWIERTILSCINQDYPIDKLEVIIVDDCSNDNSVEKIIETVLKLYNEEKRFDVQNRVKYFVQEKNLGKRDALCKGVINAKHDLVVFVDSDSFLDPFAIINLVQPFKDPKMGGVSGRTDVANTYTNTLTKMQSVRYYIAFRIMKAAEAYFDAVTCLSGPLSCYRKQIVINNIDKWINQRFLGQKATFGDDRSMTNFVLNGNRTSYQDTAICSTIVPNKYKIFLKQQMRWKRSWLRESIIAGKFMWKKEPFMATFFLMGVFVPIAAPIIVTYNLGYVPIAHNIFPTTFLVGLLMMALMMSFAQMFFRKSTTWIFGMLFCIYYEVVLLWQMPIAWVTFWKSTWGTRMTPSDVEAQRKKEQRKDFSILRKRGDNKNEK
ncbi:glycosyltransferase [Clostridium estertheticum]|uniref:Hyaluronan synthase n=1 Tax=Clostridium estertheticum TaxID=238834 RepID=A0A5N7IXC5_9CLOT|nr:glycosyltransferase [Clostridium estertheticum]MBU3183334.1 glycosyltransferase [Clostridium estertheticum]MCB2338974.1 glycosyltransferase [Clostridium estertheticum]MPQ30457.1 glycosyltransferase [Clostridium estertheticum]MPQ61133.1 glycosyltransferase [Clostridium estertheticum]